MIKVQFVAQELTNKKSKIQSTPIFFEEMDDTVKLIIKARYQSLMVSLQNYRVFCLIETLKETL